MEASLPLSPAGHSALLQEVPIDIGAGNGAGLGEENPDKLSKSTRVVVSHGLGISKGF